eukprot:767854-Hanusia_phi.AAC.2
MRSEEEEERRSEEERWSEEERRMSSEEEERRMSSEEEERERFMETVKTTLAEVQAQRCSNEDLFEAQQNKIASLEAELAHVQSLLSAEREETEKLRQAVELMRGQRGDLQHRLRELNQELSSVFSEAALTEARRVLHQGMKASQVENAQTGLLEKEGQDVTDARRRLHQEVDILSREVSLAQCHVDSLMQRSLLLAQNFSSSHVRVHTKARQCCAMLTAVCNAIARTNSDGSPQEAASRGCTLGLERMSTSAQARGGRGSDVKALRSYLNLWRMLTFWEPRRKEQDVILMLKGKSRRCLAQFVSTWIDYTASRRILCHRESVIKRNQRRALMRRCFSALQPSASSPALSDIASDQRPDGGSFTADVEEGHAGCTLILHELSRLEGTALGILEVVNQIVTRLDSRWVSVDGMCSSGTAGAPANRAEKSYPAVQDALAMLCDKAKRMFEGQMSVRQSEILSMQAEMDNIRNLQKELERFERASNH